MKRILFISFIWLFIVSSLYSQAPGRFNYQAVARNTGGNLIINQNISVRTSILTGSTIGPSEYTETHAVTTDSYGVFNLMVGGGTVVSGSFDAITWGTASKFLKIEADVTGGTTYQTLATTQILSMPYALYANKAGSVTGAIIETQGLNDVVAINNYANGQLKNVTNPTEAQDAATKSYVDVILEKFNNKGVIAIDNDDNIYPTVRIGSQIWMAENLKTTKLNDGTVIQLETNNLAWLGLTSPGYCWYDNDEAANKDRIGALYNWYAVSTGKLCPSGWHVPTDVEWTTLINYLGGGLIAGGKLKETGTSNWANPNVGATNESGFTARPGGYRNSADGGFYIGKEVADFWTSTPKDINNAFRYYMSCDYDDISQSYDLNRRGNSIRCIKD